MNNLHTPLYRAVATAKALMIAMADLRAAAEYLKEHGFTCWEAVEILATKKRGA